MQYASLQPRKINVQKSKNWYKRLYVWNVLGGNREYNYGERH